ncbi:hypothetical protein [Streptomyces shenzhenensis]|uniref:hypothetical protein n=1 Tax=Streptomyces shenzhenensis TaxID=943815 RepID=UPI00340100CE
MGTVALSGFAAAHPGRVTELVPLGPARAQDPQAREATGRHVCGGHTQRRRCLRLPARVRVCRRGRRGIRVLPGGDHGFACTPHGTYTRDLRHLVELPGYTAVETPGYYADLILVDGDPLMGITVLRHRERIVGIMKGGAFHKDPGHGTAGEARAPADQSVVVTV